MRIKRVGARGILFAAAAASCLAMRCPPTCAAENAVAAQAVPAANEQKPYYLRWSVVFSPDGKTVAVTSGSRRARPTGELSLREASTGREIAVLKRELGIRTAAYSPDGKLLAIGDFDGFAALVDPATAKVLATFPKRELPIYSVAFTPDSQLLVASCLDGTITLWDVQTKVERQKLTLPGDRPVAVAVSANGRCLAASTWQGKVHLWSLPALEKRHVLEASTAPNAEVRFVDALAFSPDSQTLLTGSWDQTIKLWDVETGNVVRDYSGHECSVQSIAFSPDGATIAAAGAWHAGTRITFWDVAHSEQKSRIDAHASRCMGLSFSPDSRLLASASWDSSAIIWDVEARTKLTELMPRHDYSQSAPVTVQMAPRREFQFKVVSQKGTPVVGAKVTPKLYIPLRGNTGPLPETLFPPTRTDEQGVWRIAIPETGDSPLIPQLQEAVTKGFRYFDVVVEHANHPTVMMIADVELARITLPDPATIEIRARRENDMQSLANVYPLFIKQLWAPVFTGRMESEGRLTLRGVDRTSMRAVRMVRFIQFPDQGRALYSEIIDLTQLQGEPLRIECSLKPGIRVEGRLSDEVPRPVKNGRIVGLITRSAAPQTRWSVNVAAEIAADGSFVFESLPAGEILQAVAYCEGWFSAPATLAEIEACPPEHGFKLPESAKSRLNLVPQLLRLEGDVIRPVVVMERASNCDVRVVEEGDRPVSNATVVFYPYHQFFGGGSSLLGHGLNGLDRTQLANVETKLASPPDTFPPIPYKAITDAAGTAVISNLPGGSGPREFRFYVRRDSSNTSPYMLSSDENRTVTVFPGKPGSTTVRLRSNSK